MLKHDPINIEAEIAATEAMADEQAGSGRWPVLAGAYRGRYEIAAHRHNRMVGRLNDLAARPLAAQVRSLAALAISQRNHAAADILDALADSLDEGTVKALAAEWLASHAFPSPSTPQIRQAVIGPDVYDAEPPANLVTSDDAREAERQIAFASAVAAWEAPEVAEIDANVA